MTREALGPAGRLARAFIESKLTPLVIVASILLGVGAVLMLPREEEPQIVVPMIDVFVQMPGASAKEVEERVTKPMEKLLWEVPGVEYLYSTSSPGQSLVVVRFKVGEPEDAAIVRLNQKLAANADRIPPGVMMVIFTRLIHRHPDIWNDPLTFDPDRFTPERSEGRHKLAWLPFGSGQRQCIAKEFSLLEGMLIMARIVSRYELSAVPGRVPQERVSTNLRTKDGMWLNLRPRLPEAKAQVPRIPLSGTA